MTARGAFICTLLLVITLVIWVTPTALCLSAALILVAFAVWSKHHKKEAGKLERSSIETNHKECFSPDEANDYRDPLRWSFLPSNGVFKANLRQTQQIENEFCTAKVLTMHRPTHEPWRESDGKYPFGWHLKGRKRLWEIRLQLRFKQMPTSQLVFGLELGSYVPISGIARQAQKALISTIRKIVGDVYHSAGDDPAKTKGEAEPPTFAMPFWAFDQFVVSDPGQEPDLAGNLAGLGHSRTDSISSYVRAMKATVDNWSTEKVYTFSIWGISQFLDCMNWDAVNPHFPMRFNFNRLCGCPPVYVAMYELKGAPESDCRHLVSYKQYYWKVALWSEHRPPAKEKLEAVVGRHGDSAPVKVDWRKELLENALGALSCCTTREHSSHDIDMDSRMMGG